MKHARVALRIGVSFAFGIGCLIPQVFAEPAVDDTFQTNPDLPVPSSVPRISKPYLARSASYSGTVKNFGGSVKVLQGGVKSLGGSLKDLEGSNKNLTVTEGDLDYIISLESDVLFDFDKATLRSEAEASLGELSKVLTEAKVKTIKLSGHTDAKGEDPYNLKLSQRRADAVAKWLQKKGGLGSVQFQVSGAGETKPVAPNTHPDGSDNPEGRQKNRRVEIAVNKS